MNSANHLGMMTYPSNPDDWCEDTLSPPEGGWSVIAPAGSPLTLDTFATVGMRSVKLTPLTGFSPTVQFALNSGREFDGTRDQAKLNVQLAYTNEIVNWGRVYLYDVAGRYALIDLTLQPGIFTQFSISLGPDKGWWVSEGFDWHFIKAIRFQKGGSPNAFWIDEFHFSYYELVLARLSVLSQVNGQAINGVRFRLNGAYFETPQYNLGIMPSTDYTIGIDSTNFKQWEDGTPSPIRTINLAEGQNLTVTATYSQAPPPPPPPSLNLGLILLGLVAVGGIIAIIIYPKLTTK